MQIPVEIFPIVGVANKEPTRYALDCVKVTCDATGACAAVAIDGRSCIRATWEADDGHALPGEVLDMVIPAAEWKGVAKMVAGKCGQYVKLVAGDGPGEFHFHYGRKEVRGTCSEFPYPPAVKELFPYLVPGKDAAEIHVPFAELRRLVTAMERITRGAISEPARLLTPRPPNRPFVIQTRVGVADVTGMTMFVSGPDRSPPPE